MLLHGVRTSSTMWRAQAAALRAAGHDVVAPDFPGHGVRAGERFTLEAAREVVEEEVSGARGGRVAVVGLSLGGYVGLSWAARSAHPPTALVLSSCTALLRGAGHVGFTAFSEALALVPPRVADGAGALWSRAFVGERGALDVAAGGVTARGQRDAVRALWRADPVRDLRTVVERGIPVTFVQGEWDHFRVDERTFRRVGGEGTRWVRVRRAFHPVGLHRPTAYTRALVDVLDRAAV